DRRVARRTVGGVLRVALTGPDADAVDGVAAAWGVRAGRDVAIGAAPWPVGADVVARHQLVVGVADGEPPADKIAAVDAWTDAGGADGLWKARVEPFAANL